MTTRCRLPFLVHERPRFIPRLITGSSALNNVRFLVAGADLSAADALIGLPVLRHLGVETKTILERDRERLDGSDCFVVSLPPNEGSISHLMIARHNRIVDEPAPAENAIRPRVDYFESKEEEDQFPDEPILDPGDAAQHDEVVSEIQAKIARAADGGLEGPL